MPHLFTGRRYDFETGLYYYRARYYSATLGRFLQTDPIGYDDQMNLYAYVGNDPVNLFDPSGSAKYEVDRQYYEAGSKAPRSLTITLEVGSLNEADVKAYLARLPDGFFEKNDGNDLSSFGRKVTGGTQEQRDRAGIASQIAGKIIADYGEAELKQSWREITKFEVRSDIIGAKAANPPGPGPVYLNDYHFSYRGNFRDNLRDLIHEPYHETTRFSYVGVLRRDWMRFRNVRTRDAWLDGEKKIDRAANRLIALAFY